ncbi:MAG: Flp pilus assembly complex ATPase component TadA [Candidatus Magasanikbacteria bacterium]|nr:Flp pilus assembly complex ATPase component TadA [Candidatus Magasanikbacteria bacterium]
MSVLPSIDDLLSGKKGKNPAQSHSGLSVASKDTEERFTKKMAQIKRHELEVETKRTAEDLGGAYPYINLEKFPISQEALRQIDLERAKRLRSICFFITPDEFRIGTLDPDNDEVDELVHEIEERNHAQGALYIISEASFAHVLNLYNTLPIIKPISKNLEIEATDIESVKADIHNFEGVEEALHLKQTTDILTIILAAGLKLDASDLHIENEENRVMVRLRIDGILHDVAELPKEAPKKLLSRIKLIASLKINITDKPQDGRFTIKAEGGEVDVRVSIIPTMHGESVVMRLLRQSEKGITLDELGLVGYRLDIIKQEIARPNGMIIATGPTGSGKSTSLYAILRILNKPDVKIITLEDPVEYRLAGVNQSQIDRDKDYTFAKGLRALLRQDPDIVMVGEIRDLETADIAVQAALTGHLLLSTVHTNTAAGAIPRLLSIGAKPFLLSAALNLLIGQRLVRKICKTCKKKVSLESFESGLREKVMHHLSQLPERDKIPSLENLFFYLPQACKECSGLGYKGRIGIFELLKVDEKIEAAFSSGVVTEFEVAAIAKENGMLSMVQDGILKALAGVTSLEEIFRVIE